MNSEKHVKKFVQYRRLIAKAALITRLTVLFFVMPYGVITSNIGVVLAGFLLYTLGNEARNLYVWLRPENMIKSVMQNIGGVFGN